MRPLTITDAPAAVLALQAEIRRSGDSRYDHRLHGVLLVAQGMSCRRAAGVLGDAPRTLVNWVQAFERESLAGLRDGPRSGRPRRLSEEQLDRVGEALREPPEEAGLTANLWDGKTLAEFVRRQFKLELGVRQCQRLFRTLQFRMRKPRPEIAHADAQRQSEHKKNCRP